MMWLKMPLLLFVIGICDGCKEVQEKHFANLAAAQQEHMVERGWLPAYVSQDAKDISVMGDLDAATVDGSYTSGDITSIREHCSDAEDSFRVSGYGPMWLRDDVRVADTSVKLRRKGYEVLRCQDGFNVVALMSRHYVSYWSTRK